MVQTDYPNTLDEWQASTHPELGKSQPEELFETCFVERYKRLQEDLWQRLVRVHSTLETLRQLEMFPFDFFYGPNDMEFWRLVFSNFFDTGCLLLHGLACDTGPDVHSLGSFKNEIMQVTWVSKGKCDLLRKTLRERKYDDAVIAIAERVQRVRDSSIAHRLHSAIHGNRVNPLTLDELWRLLRAARGLFGAISFGASYSTLPLGMVPATVGGVRARTSVDHVLDAIVRDSPAVNMPERQPEIWLRRCGHLPAAYLKTMNGLRRRVGLREV